MLVEPRAIAEQYFVGADRKSVDGRSLQQDPTAIPIHTGVGASHSIFNPDKSADGEKQKGFDYAEFIKKFIFG